VNFKVSLATLATVWLYLLAAAWPYGGWGPFLAHPARAALAVLFFLGWLAATFTRSSNLGSGVREDKDNRWILVPFTVFALVSAVLPPWCDANDRWVVDGDVARYSGVVVGAIGMVLRLWPVFVLGRRFSGLVAIQSGHTLETTGIYGTIRHPSYLGLLLTLVGWALVFRSVLGLLIALAMVWPLVARMDAEEKLLGEHFGTEYEAYRSRTRRLVPGVY
jgi:protein-S-isoprenylcysteine O-methyltransferase Ste14